MNMNRKIRLKLAIVTVTIFFVVSSLVPAQMLSEQTDEADNLEKYELEHSVIFSKGDLIFGTLKGYDVVELKDGTFINEVGKPMLPSKQIKIALPAGMTATQIRVVETEKEEIKGEFTIFPAQPLRKLNDFDKKIGFVDPDTNAYASTQAYPSELAGFLYQTDLYGQGMAVIQLYPLQYIPAEKKLMFHTLITIEVLGVDGYVCGDYLSSRVSEAERENYETMVMDMVVNPKDVQLMSPDEDNNVGSQMKDGGPTDYDYVIITKSSWIDYFQPLADWKTQKGVPAVIVDRDWIYSEYSGSSNPKKIQNFVRDAAEPGVGSLTWNAKYFLLGGDTDTIPYKTKHYYLGFGDPPQYEHIYAPSDSYYGDYDQDFTCEVHVGRASVTGPGTAAGKIGNFINKILTYEQNPPLTDYAKKAALFGFDADSITPAEETKIYIDNEHIPGNWDVSTEYDSEPGEHKADVINYLNAGNHLVNHADHSSKTSMGVGYVNHMSVLTINNVDNLHNGDRQSILYSIGCYPAAFDYDDCIAEHFVRDTDGGCIAFIGNSRYGIYSEGDPYSYSLLYDIEFFESLFPDDNYILGECFSDHKNDYYPSDDYYKCIFDGLNLLGDPELNIWSENPQSFDVVTHPDELHAMPSSFPVYVEDDGSPVNQAYVCLWKDDEVYLTGYTDGNGEVSFNPSPSDGGTMYVTVTKRNYIPYLGSTHILDSPYEPSNPSPVNNAVDVDADADISWTGGDPDGDPVTYDVYFDTSNPPQFVTTVTEETYDSGTMDAYTRYYWQIVAHDGDPLTDPTSGPIWNFRTEDNIPPEWCNSGQNTTTIPPGGSIKLYAQGRDNIALDWAYLATNETGEWLGFTGKGWWKNSWDYCKQITIDHTLVEGDLIDFPVLIAHTSSEFIDHAQPDGDDFAFVDITNTTQYAHEIEYYDDATGELWAWVNIPFLSSTEDTVVYMYYGNQTCDSQEDKEGTWNSDFKMVHHMTGTTYMDLDDSTSNNLDVTSAGGDPSYNQDGKIGRCVDFDGSGDYFKTAGFTLPTDSSHTGSAWVYVDGGVETRRYAFEGDSDFDISLLTWYDGRFKNYANSSEGFTPACYSTSMVDVNDPEWFYICTRADADNDQLDIFVNGVSEDNTDIEGMINPETQGLNIGTYRDNNNYWMNGKIDEIRISDVPRSDSWIKTEYNNMVSPSTFSTVGSEEIRGAGTNHGSPMDLPNVGGEWVWSNFTWQNPSMPQGTQVGWRIYYVDSYGNTDCTDIHSFLVDNPGIICSDCNNDGEITVGDVVYLINYLFRNGSPPVPDMCVGDCNNDGEVTVGDVVYLINYLFRGGNPPSPDCCE